MELKTIAWLLVGCLFSHLSLSVEVGDVANTEAWLTTVDSAEGRKTNALTVGAGALGAGAGLAWLYNKYKNKNPSYGSSYGSYRPPYYQGPSYHTSYPSSSTFSRPSYSRPSYSSTYYKPAVVNRPVVVHPKPSPVNPTSILAPVPQTNIQQPLYQFNGTHFVLAAAGVQSRKLANYLSAAAGLGGGAFLYNKYQEIKNRPNYGYHYRPNYAYPISQPHYSSYGQGSYISHGHGHGYISHGHGHGYPSGYFRVRRS